VYGLLTPSRARLLAFAEEAAKRPLSTPRDPLGMRNELASERP
jgi:hypothetical protein